MFRMGLITKVIDKELAELMQQKVRLDFIGDLGRLSVRLLLGAAPSFL